MTSVVVPLSLTRTKLHPVELADSIPDLHRADQPTQVVEGRSLIVEVVDQCALVPVPDLVAHLVLITSL